MECMKKVTNKNLGIRLFFLSMVLMLVSTATAMSYVVYQFEIGVTIDSAPAVTFWD